MRHNGRINIRYPETTALFNMYDKIPVSQTTTFRNPTDGLWENTNLSTQFFSSSNIAYLQSMLIQGVFEKSNNQLRITNQDEDQLKVVMRSIFLQYSKNNNSSIQSQVHELNKFVLDYCIQQVYSEAISYKKYLYDVSTMYKPINPPVLANMKQKQLELKRWF